MAYPDTLVFLGAGASAPFGVPVMKRMVKLLEEDRHLLSPRSRALAEPVWAALKQLYPTDYDIEKLLDVVHDLSEGKPLEDCLRALGPHAIARFHELLSHLDPRAKVELAQLDGRVAAGRAEYQWLEQEVSEQIAAWCSGADLNSAAEYFNELIAALWQRVLRDGQKNAAPLHVVERDQPPQLPHFCVATTNYDEIVESALARIGAVAETGFDFDSSGKILRFRLSSSFGDSHRIALLKLHGSVSWWRTTSGGVVGHPNGHAGDRLLDGSRLVRREIRYPVTTKALGGLPYAALYTRLAEALATARVWLVIGYSFGDPSIVQLFDELWTKNKGLVIVGPNPRRAAAARLPERLREGASYVKFNFGDQGLLEALRHPGPFDDRLVV